MSRKFVPRYPIDPSVKGVFSKLPPPGHPRRCQGPNRFREQCEKWARKGSHFCKAHGGYNRHYHRPLNWYARGTTQQLADRLKELAGQGPDERMSLSQEIDLARELAKKALDLYDLAHYGEKEQDENLRIASREHLKTALDGVADLVGRAARAQSLSASVISIQHIEHLAAQFTKILETHVLDEQILACCLRDLEQVKLPVAGANGGVSPDQLREAVKNMDATIGSPDSALE